MRRSTEGQLQAQMMYLQAQINELATSIQEIHRRLDVHRQELFHVKHQQHLYSLRMAEQRAEHRLLHRQIAETAAGEAEPTATHAYILDTMDE